VNPTFIQTIVEAALRTILLALTVYAGLRLLRVSNVLAQKTAWGLVLAAALLMPMLMHWQGLPVWLAIKLPARILGQSAEAPLPTLASTSVPIAARADAQRPAFPGQSSASRAMLTPGSPSAPAHPGTATTFPLSGTPEQPGEAGDRFPAPTVSSTRFDAQSSDRPQPGPSLQRTHEPPSIFRRIQPLALAGLLYCLVCAGLLLRMAIGLVKALNLWMEAQPIAPELGHDFAPGLRLRWSEHVASPITIGSGVVLPSDFVDWDVEKLRIVLAHEGSHIRQGDFYLQMLAGLYAAIFWFSPLGWWLKAKLSELGEAISDHAGLEEAKSRASYAQILLEFAAMPRPTLIGVAMARTSNLSQRIERLLNESIFSQAFAGSRSRMIAAVLLVPVALFAATALVHVEAAQTDAPAISAVVAKDAPAMASDAVQAAPRVADQTAAQAAMTGQSKPDEAADSLAPPAQDLAAPAQDQPPALPPAPPSAGAVAPQPLVTPVAPAAPMPPSPQELMQNDQSQTTTNTNGDPASPRHISRGRGYAYTYSANGVSWALITDGSQSVRFSGDWHNGTRDMIEKVRSQGHGKFLVFTRDSKSYFIDDAATIAQIEAMYKPIEELGRQQAALGKQQQELGKQQRDLGEQQRLTSVPTPDLSKEMADLNAAMAKLQAKMGATVTQADLSEVERKMGEIQSRLGALQGKMGAAQGKLGQEQGKLGAEQGKLGAEQGRLGAEQGRISQENDRKVQEMIGQSLSNGMAKPVQ
jgi:hypothetical protein